MPCQAVEWQLFAMRYTYQKVCLVPVDAVQPCAINCIVLYLAAFF